MWCFRNHISRHVTKLEQRLNTQLLTRTTRKVVLTKEGEQFLHQVKQLQQAMDEATQGLASVQTSPTKSYVNDLAIKKLKLYSISNGGTGQ